MDSLNERKSIPLGAEDFREIIERNGYYVDKTGLIADIIKKKLVKVKLITRPRRFGKTLNLSMLRYFFNIEGAEENRELFNGLEIEKTPYMEHFGSYPVISLTLKGVKGGASGDMHLSMRQLMADVFRKHKFLLDSDKLMNADLYRYNKILSEDEPGLGKALFYLCELLYRHYGKKVIVLMDEYDAPVINAYVRGYYNEAIDFFKDFMSSTFKTNEYLEMGIITGVSRVSRESIFSDMNNVEVYSVLSDTFAERFGFTSEEVSGILEYYGYADREDEVRRYYDGYRFAKYGDSEVDIYNPLSILKFADSGHLEPYWVNTASDELIRNVAVKDLPRFMEVSEDLLQGVPVEGIIEEGITFLRLDSIDSLWTLLLYAGYITVSSHNIANRYFLRIPNEEITSYFRMLLWDIYSTEIRTPDDFTVLLFSDRRSFWERLNRRLSVFSYFDLTSERDYHLYLTCALLMNPDVGSGKTYEVYSNRESGSGRPDIMVTDRKRNRAVIFELKYVKSDFKSEEEKEQRISEALESAEMQLKSRNYGADFQGETEYLSAVGCAKAFYAGQ